MNTVTVLNHDEFENLLLLRNRTEPVEIITRTDPGMNTGKKDKELGKYPNPFVDSDGNSLVEKLARRVCFIGADYESCVNRQRMREEQPSLPDGSVEYFIAESLWKGKGQRINKFLVTHVENGGAYICIKPQSTNQPTVTGDYAVQVAESQYRWKETQQPLTEAEVALLKTWLKSKGSPSKRQEVDKPVFWQVIKLENVLQIKIGGEYYVIQPE